MVNANMSVATAAPALKPLTPQQMLMAYMIAAGRAPAQVALELNCSVAHVHTSSKHPYFKLQVEDIQKQVREQAVSSLVEEIMAEGQGSLKKVVSLRDHGESDQVQLAAANSLLDRIVPKKQHVENENTLRVVFGTAELRQMMRAIAEDEGLSADVIDVTPELSKEL